MNILRLIFNIHLNFAISIRIIYWNYLLTGYCMSLFQPTVLRSVATHHTRHLLQYKELFSLLTNFHIALLTPLGVCVVIFLNFFPCNRSKLHSTFNLLHAFNQSISLVIYSNSPSFVQKLDWSVIEISNWVLKVAIPSLNNVTILHIIFRNCCA